MNSHTVESLGQGELSVQAAFAVEFPDKDFGKWNTDVDDNVAAQIIENAGRASTISVKQLIEYMESTGHDVPK
jgi:hypothetical protein